MSIRVLMIDHQSKSVDWFGTRGVSPGILLHHGHDPAREPPDGLLHTLVASNAHSDAVWQWNIHQRTF
jgi:hypothetical protein